MITKQFRNALKEISSTLNDRLHPWALIGSTNLALQGINTIPHDLDLVMKLVDLGVASQKFQRYNPSGIEKLFPDEKDPAWTAKLKRYPAYNMHFNLNGVDVHILGERNNGDYVSKLIANQLIYFYLCGSRIPCFTLDAEAQVYDTYRPKKTKLIMDFLEGLKKA